MKRNIFLLIFCLILPTTINAGIDPEIFKLCISQNDFDSCVEKLSQEKLEKDKAESERIKLEKNKEFLIKKQYVEIDKNEKKLIEKSTTKNEFKNSNSDNNEKEELKNPYGDPSEWSSQDFKFWEKECQKLNMVFLEKKLLCDSLGIFNDDEYIWKKGRYRKKK